jgi:hypothetical protein
MLEMEFIEIQGNFKMNIAVCSLAIGDEYGKAIKLCRKSLSEYCQKHNYTFVIQYTDIIENRDLMWNKIPLIRKILPKYDYVVWVDADMMIMNYDFHLERLIELYLGSRDMLLSCDSGNQINTGFWVIKNSPFSQDILSLIEHCPEIAGHFHEQGVLNTLYYENRVNGIQNRIRILGEIEQRLINATIYNYVIGDFLIHFLGVRNNERLSMLSNDHFPRQKENEDDLWYKKRKDWFEQKYSNVRNPRYIIPSPKVKIAVCEFFTGEKYSDSVIKYGQLSMQKYCQKHAYKYIVETKQLVSHLKPHWTKFALLSQTLKSNDCDFAVWFDADIMIMNHDIKIEDIIEQHMNGKDFLLSRDISNEINTGVCIVRNTEYAVKILDTLVKFPELKSHGNHDQDTFNIFYNRNIMDFSRHCSIIDKERQHIMNCCVGKFKYGYWLIHFISMSKEWLEKAFNDFYPFKKDEENEFMYLHRISWVKNCWK